jgi:hypothetical protein
MYDAETKARAMAMLLTSDTTRYVGQQTGIPRTTLRRCERALWPKVRETLVIDASPFNFRPRLPLRASVRRCREDQHRGTRPSIPEFSCLRNFHTGRIVHDQ